MRTKAPPDAARTCTDIAADFRLRIWSNGGRWALFLADDGKPCFSAVESLIFAILERMDTLHLVGVYDARAAVETIAGDIADARAAH